ncbi:M28 family peptidase [Aliiglaciecola sp. 3_MG-2023]|uniref:M20/M25/M40 family metallo-hydrolase n=1 Tax=Aliiglaciecola sp. 3_MG-2023 TaxID=3062644 RepID=UPI0026E18D6A|nr:M20/M25/M40 family metallo-hydrolase [Aliiglaciecola sp. 3_MG-2023]MDO6692956.1 M28 family peptidase [Aliiglaciecola sp. 3_MG-2023]
MIVKNIRLIASLCLLLPVIGYADCNKFELYNTIDSERLWEDFSYLASDDMQGRKNSSSGSLLAQEFLISRFTEIGLKTLSQNQTFRMPFRYETTFSHIDGVNIGGYLIGTTYPQQYIVITAHYDHLGMRGNKIFNGADDNASGVSAMLAIADEIAQQGSQHSIIFLATDAEEKGLYGSKAFVQNPPVPLEQIKYNLNLDMISQNQEKSRLYVSGARYYSPFKGVVAKAIEEAGLCLVNQHRRNRRGYAMAMGPDWRKASDHASFGKVDIPYLFVGVGEHKYYHTEKDIVETVDQNFFQAAVETSFNILKLMDQLTD